MQVLEDEVVEELEASVTEIYQKIFSPFLLLDFFFFSIFESFWAAKLIEWKLIRNFLKKK